ncbi:MAG: hypothetical protein RJB39_394 [Candidatus Parcubacteria bacterium]|jgi:SET domain-containing protein
MRRSYTPDKFKVIVKRSNAGLGLFAGDDIPKGTCIIEYKGRQIKGQEEYTSTSKYLFGVHDRLTIDGRERSNTARYINHSCRANCEPISYKARAYIFAKRKIMAGEELTYDYGKEYWNEHIKPLGCRCVKCVERKATVKE